MLSLDTPAGVRDAVTMLDQVAEVTEQVLAARRMVSRRARVLNCSSLIPSEWRKAPVTAAGAVELPQHERVLMEKAEASGADVDALRRAYLDGVREYAMLPAVERPPFDRDTYAQARVNTALRQEGV